MLGSAGRTSESTAHGTAGTNDIRATAPWHWVRHERRGGRESGRPDAPFWLKSDILLAPGMNAVQNHAGGETGETVDLMSPRRVAFITAGALVVANAADFARVEEASATTMLTAAGGALLVALGLRRR